MSNIKQKLCAAPEEVWLPDFRLRLENKQKKPQY